jgi:hypothetical protein
MVQVATNAKSQDVWLATAVIPMIVPRAVNSWAHPTMSVSCWPMANMCAVSAIAVDDYVFLPCAHRSIRVLLRLGPCVLCCVEARGTGGTVLFPMQLDPIRAARPTVHCAAHFPRLFVPNVRRLMLCRVALVV